MAMVSRCCGRKADLEKTFFWNLPSVSHKWARFDFPLLVYLVYKYLEFKVGGDGHLNPLSRRVTSINFLLTLTKMMNKGEMLFDLLSGSLI